MALNESQKTAIAKWLAAGDSLSQIQSKLKSEFSVSMTFMEVRFLIDDLNLELKKAKPAVPVETADDAEDLVENFDDQVSVEVDTIVTPGSLVSGSVHFSDGVNAKWHLDQMGRLGLSGVEPGYQPSSEDIREFQTLLQTELRKKGFG